MDKIHLLNDSQTDRMYYANELSEAGRDVASMNSPPLFKLIDQHVKRMVERRAHKRFQVNKNTFALVRPVSVKQIRVTGRSMGEIACALYRSKLTKFGRINNISMGGLSFLYVAGEERSNESLVLDILLTECGFYLESLTFLDISDFEIPDDFSSEPIKMRQHHVQFERLASAQIAKLKHFINNYIYGM
jgi:hypothetical protein